MDYFGLPPTDVRVKADVDVFIEQLLSELQIELKRSQRWDGKARAPQEKLDYSEQCNEQIAPTDIEVALAEIGGDQKFTLAHLPLVWSGAAYRFREPLDYLGHDGGGRLSAGPGLTIGAALALKDSKRPVISVLGDGDFLQGATALWTAAHYSIPALFIVSNNQSNYNDEIHQNTIAGLRQRPRENAWSGQRISDPEVDLTAIAKGQGVEGEGPIKTVPALSDAIRRALDIVRQGRPYFIDAHVTRPPQSEAPTGGRIRR